MTSHKHNYHRRAAWLSIAAGAFSWVADAAIDSFIFREGPFPALINAVGPQEIFMRFSVMLAVGFAVYYGLGIAEHRRAEEALRNSERQYKLLFENNPNPMLIFDLETLSVLNVNGAAVLHYGYSREEFLAMTIKDIRPPEEVPALLKYLEKSPEGSDRVTARHMKKSGEIIDVEITSQNITFNGRAARIVLVIDVTDRKGNEERLKQSEKKYRSLFESSKDAIYISHRDGPFLEVNQAALDLFGYTRDEMIGMDIRRVYVNPDDRARFQKEIEQNGSIKDYTLRFIKKDGTEMECLLTSVLLTNDRGEVLGYQGIIRDVTEQKKMEAQLYQAKEDWESTFDTITDMITVHDRDFNIIRANKAAAQLLGLPLLDITKAKCYEYYHGAGCPPESCPSCLALKTSAASTSEIFEPHLNKFIEVRAIPRFDSAHNLVGLIHVVRDITEQKKLESQLRQAQKMEAVGQLAGGVAHDFNNILSAIIGYGHLLLMKMEPDDPSRNSVEQILEASERATTLTRSLLAFSRQQVINLKQVEVNHLIERFKKFLLRLIREDIELRTVLSAEELPVMADAGQIEQVLMNLVANARDAMPDGGLLMISTGMARLDEEFVRIYGYGKAGNYVLITVSDTGTGMDEETRNRIFEPFFTTKEQGKGTGLGLSMVYGIIKQHEGYITAYSNPGQGTTFKMYLPVVRPKVGVGEEERQLKATPVRGGSETILIAEDDEALRKLSSTVLSHFGYAVITAVDGEDAVLKFIENRDKIQLVIMDVIMPKKNGNEAYRDITQIKPGLRALFTSGYTADVISSKKILDKEFQFIPKPVSPIELLKKVREILDA